MFSIVNGVVLRGLPFDHADRIVVVGAYDKKRPEPPRPGNLSAVDFADVRAAQRSFEELAGCDTFDGDVTLLGPDGIPLRYEGARLTPNVLQMLRTASLKGRGFTDANSRCGPGGIARAGASRRSGRSAGCAQSGIARHTLDRNQLIGTVAPRVTRRTGHSRDVATRLRNSAVARTFGSRRNSAWTSNRHRLTFPFRVQPQLHDARPSGARP